MKAYYKFLRSSFKPVYFGWLLMFFSSFGQTFFISLFVPSILREFGFSRAAFGIYYSSATLLASVFLLKIGDLIDRKPIRPFTMKTTFLLAGSCFLLSAATHPVMVFAALTGLRLGGQSLMPHISSSVMSRHFDRDRGKALSFSSLGFASGEIVFPLIVGALISFYGWRSSVSVAGAVLILVLVPVLRRIDIEVMDVDGSQNSNGGAGGKTRFFLNIMKRRNFWVIALPSGFLSLTLTGLFFYQYTLAETGGWSMAWHASCYAGFGLAKLSFALCGGALVDRFNARRIFPFFLIPSVLGFFALAYVTGPISPAVFLPLMGVTVGLSSVVTSAAIAEAYGVRDIGKVRSLFTVLIVIGAAAGPVPYGLLLDAGYSFKFIALASAAVLILLSLSNTQLEPASETDHWSIVSVRAPQAADMCREQVSNAMEPDGCYPP